MRWAAASCSSSTSRPYIRIGHVPVIEDVPVRGVSKGESMIEDDLSAPVAAWVFQLKHASSTIEADVRDALERSETEADFLIEAAAAIERLIAECHGHLRYLDSVRGEAA